MGFSEFFELSDISDDQFNLTSYGLNSLRVKLSFAPPMQDDSENFGGNTSLKVVLYNIDVTAMCSLAKCKQLCLIDHLLHS